MYQDRGIIKFSPFLMPEHRELLHELREREQDITVPLHDGQQLEEWNLLILEAMEFARYLQIRYIKNGRLHTVVGRVHYLDEKRQSLRVKGKGEEQFYYILISSIHSIDVY
jgi:hypothetical protein